ncbi:hypothetical protein HYPSUDRAFT_37635 [Hypholoma sublateritium FD-334 SS-4]|uniref:Cytochrome P450 n=1 Tax=Hypholoma sublateritium (strain FD-334 SS-4) TaxID=945553 RepID=A0A0D2MNU4_HYPSF|nr:hypothetical protein HYPSUDRAFT_37635 [Hypholoma sublateritium FD-334 SS-4]
MSVTYYVSVAAFLAGLAFLWRRNGIFQSRSRGYPLPPGPRPLPVLGNLFDMPLHYPWKKFLEWKEPYGDLVYVEALGNRTLCLNSIEAVNDLLVKRASHYSDRPTLVMVGELMHLENSTPFLQYGPTLREHRKLFHAAMGPEISKKYLAAQKDAVALLINSILHNPKDFWKETRLMGGRIILSTIYGIPAMTPVDQLLDELDQVMKIAGAGTLPGAHMVDMIPALKYLPSWLPFNNIHKFANKWRTLVYSTLDKPYEYVEQQMKQGIDRPSCTAEFIRAYESESGRLDAKSESLIKWGSASLYAPGSETTFGVTLVFIHAMALYPNVQQKIQAEIDNVVGKHRLPTISDRANLPYVCAAIKEALRWHPMTPMGLARRTNKDDYYNGYFIPANTVVLPNVWAISRDKISGIPPEEFAPERFMTEAQSTDAIDPYLYAFGFSRRECPGRHLADNSLFLIISWLVATVSICKSKNADGVEEFVEPSYISALISYPGPFEVDFKHRNEELETLIKHYIAEID